MTEGPWLPGGYAPGVVKEELPRGWSWLPRDVPGAWIMRRVERGGRLLRFLAEDEFSERGEADLREESLGGWSWRGWWIGVCSCAGGK